MPRLAQARLIENFVEETQNMLDDLECLYYHYSILFRRISDNFHHNEVGDDSVASQQVQGRKITQLIREARNRLSTIKMQAEDDVNENRDPWPRADEEFQAALRILSYLNARIAARMNLDRALSSSILTTQMDSHFFDWLACREETLAALLRVETLLAISREIVGEDLQERDEYLPVHTMSKLEANTCNSPVASVQETPILGTENRTEIRSSSHTELNNRAKIEPTQSTPTKDQNIMFGIIGTTIGILFDVFSSIPIIRYPIRTIGKGDGSGSDQENPSPGDNFQLRKDAPRCGLFEHDHISVHNYVKYITQDQCERIASLQASLRQDDEAGRVMAVDERQTIEHEIRSRQHILRSLEHDIHLDRLARLPERMREADEGADISATGRQQIEFEIESRESELEKPKVDFHVPGRLAKFSVHSLKNKLSHSLSS
jgi:hypothetical protein